MGSGGALRWDDDGTLAVGDERFSLMDAGVATRLVLFKSRQMVEDYAPIIDEFRGCRFVELGIFRGGSTAFFALTLDPARLVAFELETERVAPLDDLVREHGLEERVRLHYGVDQADRERLGALVDEELGGEAPDLVIDDASHLYEPTIASFEVLFPRVRPGGLYVIEDWVPPYGFIDLFITIVADRPSEASAALEAGLLEQLDDPASPGRGAFVEWFARCVIDPAARYHGEVSAWFKSILADDSTTGAALRAHLQTRVAEGRPGAGGLANLTTLGAELVVAAARGPRSGIAGIHVNPHWLAIRRSDVVLDPVGFSYRDLTDDSFGALGPHRPA